MKKVILQLLIFIFCVPVFVEGQIHYVKVDGTGDGSSWENASGDLQVTLNNTTTGDTIWLASGTYRPVACATCTTEDRNTFFVIENEIVLLGGFSSAGNPVLMDRDWELYPTILSGDIGVAGDSLDNSRRIISSQSDLTIDGLTITSANSDLPADGGAGLRVKNLFASNCTFKNNTSINNGGAVGLTEPDSTLRTVQLFNCQFRGNTAEAGGAIFIPDSTNCQFESYDSYFENNEAVGAGGAIKIGDASYESLFDRCHFINNKALDGACINYGTHSLSFKLRNSLFYDNFSSGNGGVLSLSSPCYMDYCTFYNNKATGQGNVAYAKAEGPLSSNRAYLTANIFYNNGDSLINNFTIYAASPGSTGSHEFRLNRNYTDEDSASIFCNNASSVISLSTAQGNPFIDPGNDFHLLEGSGAINVGSNVSIYSTHADDIDIEGKSRYISVKSDLGAYEYRPDDCPGTIAYVNPLAVGENDGTTWENAFTNLNEALNKISYCESTELWIAEGIYSPTECFDCYDALDPERFVFKIFNTELTLIGGFPNTGNPAWEDRNWESYPTILTGNFGDTTGLIPVRKVVSARQSVKIQMDGIQVRDSKDFGIYTDESIVILRNCKSFNNQRDGIYGLGSVDLYNCRIGGNVGYGISIEYGSASIRDCEIDNNGFTGVYCSAEGSISITNSWLHHNSDEAAKNGDGNVYVVGSRFSNNEKNIISASRYDKQGYKRTSVIKFDKCIFDNNISTDVSYNRGGLVATDVIGSNSLFYGNAGQRGAAILCDDADVTNCTFVNNIAFHQGAAIYSKESATIKNCIFWGNESTGTANTIDTDADGNISLQNTLTNHPDCETLGPQIMCNGENIFDAYDPFVDIVNENFQLSDTSQAVNAGENSFVDLGTFDLNGLPRVAGNTIDIGAYEQNYCSFYFRTQSDIDSFSVSYPNVSVIECDVYLSSAEEDPIINLDGLSQITNIEGFFWVENNKELTSLSGLENLIAVDGFLQLSNNSGLANLEALNNLESLGRFCRIQNNDNLITLNSLENLQGINGDLEIVENVDLNSISGFNSLASINGNFIITSNPELTTIEGFNNMLTIEEDLQIGLNQKLNAISSLGSLQSIGGELNIRYTKLANLDFLSSLISFEELELEFNDNLISLSGLNNVDPQAVTTLRISYNDALSFCNEPFICAYLGLGNYAHIWSNDAGCSNIVEVLIACNFVDNDNDGYYNNTDCDDNDLTINPGANEIPFNNIDDDCDETTLDNDGDQDGSPLGEDCDDDNPLVGPTSPEVPYNGIDDDCDETTPDDDIDQDGFPISEDCDDNNILVNPEAIEIPYNGIDDDCNEITLDDDLDGDGFPLAEDCDDGNPLLNPDAVEIPYNGIDEDCNEFTFDDDLDQDGFPLAEDCVDDNSLINPNAVEIPYNGIDDDCNEQTLDDDLDQDGYPLAEDCDDENPLLNPDAIEIFYNGIDDDCNELTLDDDLDQDGFPLSEDCADDNPDLNPDAIDIPNNGIDEDCDGEDLIIIGTDDLLTIDPQIFPNPTTGLVQVVFPTAMEANYELYDLNGKQILNGFLEKEMVLDLSIQPEGVYILSIKSQGGVWTKRVVKLL